MAEASRMQLENVSINEIVPNPLNPRQDYSIETKKMQEIIKKRGWETGITCYIKDGKYVILSGHRRWYAATQLKEASVPVFVVQAPRTAQEELERLGSSQGGKVDWSPYEWAKYTFDLWIMKGKPTYRELALRMGASDSITSARVRVFRYYPHQEIEAKLEEGTLTITILSEIIDWIEKLKKQQPKVIDELGVDVIRANMVRKAGNKRFSGLQLRTDKFIELAEPEQIIEFVRNTRMKLKDAYDLIDDGENTVEKSKVRKVVNAVERRTREVNNMDAKKPEDARRLYFELEELLEKVLNKKNEAASYIDS